MHAEQAYLFRHALLRDAAYQLQPLGDRGRLHQLALEATERVFGGPPPGPRLDEWGEFGDVPHALNLLAAEMAAHARLAGEAQPADTRLKEAQLHYLRIAAFQADKLYRPAEATEFWRDCAEICEPAVAAGYLRRAGMSAQLSEQHTQALQYLTQAVLKAQEQGDRAGEAAGARLLAAQHRNEGRIVEANEWYEKVIAIHREIGNDRGYCVALSGYGAFLYETGRPDEAARAYAEGLRLAAESGNLRTEGVILGNVANLHVDKGEMAEAEKALLRALEIHRQVGNRRFEAVGQSGLGNFYLGASRYDEAEAAYDTALQIYRETGSLRFEGVTLGNVALLYEETGRHELAEGVARRALAIHREVENRRGVGVALGSLARLAARKMELEAAEQGYLEALRIHDEVGNRHFQGYTRCELARVLLRTGRVEEAREQWRLGEDILTDLGDTATRDNVTTAMLKDCNALGISPLSS